MMQPSANLMMDAETLEQAKKRYTELSGQPPPEDFEQRLEDEFRRQAEGQAALKALLTPPRL